MGHRTICLSQIFISFPLVVLNNRNKVTGIKLLHKKKDSFTLIALALPSFLYL